MAPEQLVAAVEAAGYQAVLPSAEPAGPDGGRSVDETAPLRQRLLVSLALMLPVLAMAMIPPLQFESLAVAVADARRAGRGLGRAGRSTAPRGRTSSTRTATMDTLISVGVLAAFGVVAVRAVHRRRRHARHDDDAST